jgi:FkbM family methyltransferase
MSALSICYGTIDKHINVTGICFQSCYHHPCIVIPAGEGTRCYYFTDPHFNSLKSIFISLDGKTYHIYNHTVKVSINVQTCEITTVSVQDTSRQRLQQIHSTLHLAHGFFHDEFPEQEIACRYLTGTEKVLEIGANIGRNTLVIASILEDNSNFVTLECEPAIVKQLTENRDRNGFTFHIEPSALSKRKLIQSGWDTKEVEHVTDDLVLVPTITLEELRKKYPIAFDTLILDCEGAFYYILQDMASILDGINLIIMENDYWDLSKKLEIDIILRKNGFYVDYVEGGGWGPCQSFFYEAWKR